MTVSYVKSAKAKGYLRIGINTSFGKSEFTVSEKDFRAAGGFAVGDNLTRDTFEFLSCSDMEYKAKAKALRILCYGDNSERMLMRKLTSSGISKNVAEKTVSEMVSLGYINASRQLELLITNEVRLHNSGPRKIVQKLIAKGYNAKDITEKISELQRQGEIDFEMAKERLKESKLAGRSDTEEVKKLLYKNGYFV